MRIEVRKILLSIAIPLLLGSFFVAGCSQQQASSAKGALVAGVVPHHRVADDMIEEYFIQLKKEMPNLETIVIVGQDHYDQLTSPVVTGRIGKTNFDLLRQFEAFGVEQFSAAINQEHAFTELEIFINQHLPDVAILPIMHTDQLSQAEVDKMAEFFVKVTDENTFFLVSIDFSHHLHQNATRFHDLRSIDIFANFEDESFSTIEGDLWQSMYLVRKIADLKGANQFELFDYGVTSDYFDTVVDDNVGYVSAFFREGESNLPARTVTMIFTGAIDLDKASLTGPDKYFPFEKVHHLLRGTDVAMGYIDEDLLTDEVVKTLYEVYFTGLTVRGEEPEASKISRDSGLRAIEATRMKFDAGRVVLLDYGFEDPSFDKADVLAEIVLEAGEEGLIIVQIDWGELESENVTDEQREFAHALVDAGADIVIGQGSAFVQEQEIYNEKAIFYSIGKLILGPEDSADIKESLALGIALKEQETEVFVFPLEHNNGQPKMSYTSERSVIFSIK